MPATIKRSAQNSNVFTAHGIMSRHRPLLTQQSRNEPPQRARARGLGFEEPQLLKRWPHRDGHLQLTETPTSRPMRAVTVIAKAPPIVTRNAARPSGAPPR